MITEEALKKLEFLRSCLPSMRRWKVFARHEDDLPVAGIVDARDTELARSRYRSVVEYLLSLHERFEDMAHTIRRQRTTIEELQARIHQLEQSNCSGCADHTCPVCWGYDEEREWWNVS